MFARSLISFSRCGRISGIYVGRMTSLLVNSPSLLSRWLNMSPVTGSLGIKYASSQGRKGFWYNKFVCQFFKISYLLDTRVGEGMISHGNR